VGVWCYVVSWCRRGGRRDRRGCDLDVCQSLLAQSDVYMYGSVSDLRTLAPVRSQRITERWNIVSRWTERSHVVVTTIFVC
jgi:hypothetical protein